MTRLDQASNGDAGGSRAHQTCGEFAGVKKPTEQKQSGATKINKIGTVLNNIHQFKIPAHRLNRSRSAQEINKDRKTEAELADVMDTLQHAISIIEKEIAKNLTFLQKEIAKRSTNNATVELIKRKTPMPTAFSKQCQ